MTMQIRAVVFSSDLVDSIDGLDARASGERYATILAATLVARYPGADVEVDVRHGVSGYGAGITCADAEGRPFDADTEDDLRHLAGRVWEEQDWAVVA